MLACLCSPNITAYVTDEINDHVMSMIRQDPAAFKIPVGIFHDPDLAEELAAKVGAAMTKQRSRLRATVSTLLPISLDVYPHAFLAYCRHRAANPYCKPHQEDGRKV